MANDSDPRYSTIAHCESCGQEMRGIDYFSRLRVELAASQAAFAEAVELIKETLAEGIAYSGDRYDEVQMSHTHREDLRAFLAKHSAGKGEG